MFFSKEAKQAFVFPTKTGTMSVRHFLGSIGWHGKVPVHKLTKHLIEEYPALSDYQLFGFYRDPVKRLESAILHIKQMPGNLDGHIQELLGDVSMEDAPYEFFTSHEILKKFEGFFLEQVAWLDHPKVTTLDFSNLEAELRRVTGNTTQPMFHKNKNSDFGRKEITPTFVEFVKKHYAADYEFARYALKIGG